MSDPFGNHLTLLLLGFFYHTITCLFVENMAFFLIVFFTHFCWTASMYNSRSKKVFCENPAEKDAVKLDYV